MFMNCSIPKVPHELKCHLVTKNFRPVALAIIELHLSENKSSQLISQSVTYLAESFTEIENFKLS